MSEWKEKTIDEMCYILDNFRIPLNQEQRFKIQGNIPYYGANGVQGYISQYIFDDDLILMAEDGGNFEEYQRRPIAYKITGKSWVNNHAHVLKAKESYCQTYIFYSVIHKNIMPFIKGGTRSKLNLSDLKNIKVNIPPLPQQQKIAKILSTCDDVIDKTQQAIKKYQAIKQGMMNDLFTRGIDEATGKLRATYAEQPDLYKETELGWIPKAWDVVKLEDYFKTEDGDRGKNYPNESHLMNDGHCLFLSAKNVTKNGFKFKNNIFISKERDELLSNGKLLRKDIIITTRGTVGNIAFYDDSIPFENMRINSGMLILRSIDEDRLRSDFLHQFLYSRVFINQLERILSGSAQPQITVKNMNDIKVVLTPNTDEQIAIIQKVEAISNKIKTEQATLKKYQQIKAGLMQDLLTGNVHVTV